MQIVPPSFELMAIKTDRSGSRAPRGLCTSRRSMTTREGSKTNVCLGDVVDRAICSWFGYETKDLRRKAYLTCPRPRLRRVDG